MWDSTGTDGGLRERSARAKREAEYFEQRGLPAPGEGRLQQVLHGLSLPLHLARALWADPVARGRYLRVCSLQFLVILGLGLFFMKSGQEVAGTVQDGRRARAGLPPMPSMPPLPPLPGEDTKKDAEERAEEFFTDEDVRATVLAAAEAARAAGLDVEVEIDDDPQERAQQRAKDASERAKDAWVEAAAQVARVKALEAVSTPLPELEQARHEAAAAQLRAKVAHAEARAAHVRAQVVRGEEKRRRLLDGVRWREFTVRDLEFWAALLTAMHIVQYVVVALSRDYHDAIGRDVSLLTGLKPEDGPLEPRVRLNLKWLATKMKRRWRAIMLLILGMPLFWLVTAWSPWRSTLFTALTSAWAAWWYLVFSASKSARAWDYEATAPRPWFLRGWTWLTTHMPGFRWGVPRAYGRFLETQSRFIFSPAACVEEQPWALTGMALLRALGLIPGVKMFVRPLIPVAAAHLLEAHRVAQPALPAPVSLPLPAPEASPALEASPAPAKVANAP